MGLKFYADRGSRRTRQIVADVALALWCVLAIWAGTVVHDRALVAQSGAQKLEHGSSSLALNMTDAANAVAKVPFVGSEVRTPFDKAAGTATDMAGSGHDLATGLGRFAVLLGVLTAALPIVLALVPWLLTRPRYAVTAGRLARLRSMPGGRRLLALEALTSASPRALAAIDDDVARAWQDDDPEATRKLADLSLATYGLRLRDDVLENGVREEDVLDGRATDAEE